MRQRTRLRRYGPSKDRRWKSAVVAAAAVLGTIPGIAFAGAGTAAADTGPAGDGPPSSVTLAPQTADPAPPAVPLAPQDDGLSAAQHQALQAAKDQAAASGAPVVVDALTTETSTTTANPDGTLTGNSSLLPTRVRQQGGWIPVDATLVRNPDGTYRPAAASGSLTLSGGGSTVPLAAMNSGGQQLSFGWPTALPAAVASGASLTYPEVLPGVDLKVTATTLGGFSEVLIVKSAASAADPALRELTLALHATGVTVKDDDQDNLTAVTPDSQVAFSAPRPIMWDSAHADNAPAAVKAPAAKATTEAGRAAAADPVTPDAGPPPGAHVAYVGADVTSGALTLTPDQGLLNGSGTVYPVFIDPSWIPHPASGSGQHWNEVQAACPTTTSNYDSTYYGDPGVGDNTYTGCVGVERSYFQLSVPSIIWGTHIVSAAINVTETYAAQCDTTSTISMYQTAAINSKFSWNSKPRAGTKIDDQSFAPACSSFVSGGFEAASTVARAAAGHWSALTYVLVNANESNGYYFKRFATNPSMSITYNHAPDPPTGLAVKLNAATYGCATTTPYPILGKTVATTPPVLDSVVTDKDKDKLSATYAYWTGSATAVLLHSATVSSGQHAPMPFPSTYISHLADGSVVNWQAASTDGEDTTKPSPTCHFTVDQRAPAEPTITSNGNLYPDIGAGGGPGAAAGTPGTFTVKVDPGTTNNNASKFVFGLDTSPPGSNPPAAQTKTATNNSATFTVTPVAHGTHTLFVYAVDSAGNASPAAQYHFTAVGHLGKTYASLSSAFNNTAVSSDAAMSGPDADGSGHSFSLTDLQAMGWQPGQKLTVDGATFTLPAFGSGTADNVLAANQTITMNSQHGNALVFLATSTGATYPSQHQPDDHSSPFVPDGTSISATNCSFGDAIYTDCSEASGTITYDGGAADPQSFYLPVPDWATGPGSLAAVSLPHVNRAAGQTASARKIYAFAVPLAPGVPVTSVTLPDLSDSAKDRTPGLHIFGMAVRDTTSAPAGASWTGAWSSPNEALYRFSADTGFSNQTFRTSATPSTAGSKLRIRLSNAGGKAPLVIDHVTVADQSTTVAAASTPTSLTFNGGSASLTIPVGGEVYSDPLDFPVTALHPILVSFHLVSTTDYIVMHTAASAATTHVSAAGSGDHTADVSGTAFSGTGTSWGYVTDVLTGIDVVTTDSQPTIAVLGDSVHAFTGNSFPQTAPRISDNLASALQSNTQEVEAEGVVASGIVNNMITTDQGGGGASALTRLDRDVLSVPGISTVVVDEGLQDIVSGVDDTVVTADYQILLDQLQAWGIKTVVATLTPCDGYAPCTTTVDNSRQSVNQWVSDVSSGNWPGSSYADLNSNVALDDPNSTSNPAEQMLSAQAAPLDFDTGDHINLTADGYAAVSHLLTDDLSVVTRLPKP
jgi:hypothetical protein